jgi:hypothetical protein
MLANRIKVEAKLRSYRYLHGAVVAADVDGIGQVEWNAAGRAIDAIPRVTTPESHKSQEMGRQ